MTLMPYYSFASADSLLLAAGCLTFVIAFFGCCGAWFQSRCMLITVRSVRFRFRDRLAFARGSGSLLSVPRFHGSAPLPQYFGLVMLMFLAEFMLGTLAFTFRAHLARNLKQELLYGIEKHYNLTKEPGTIPVIWDHIQSEVRDYSSIRVARGPVRLSRFLGIFRGMDKILFDC